MFITIIASKLFEKSPLNSVLVQMSRALKPRLLSPENKVSLLKMLKGLTQKLHVLKLIDAECGDKAYTQYQELINNKDFIKFQDNDCLDDFFFQKK